MEEQINVANDQATQGSQEILNDQGNSSAEKVKILSAKNRKIGLYLIIGPFIGVIVALIGVVIIKAIQGMIGVGDVSGSIPSGSVAGIITSLINWVLIAIGILSIIGFIFGIPIGIIYLCKREIVDGLKYDERSGNKENSIIPEEIKGWNWGAAGLTWIWGISQGVWISLLAFIPIVNIVMWIILGIKGNEWAWRSQKWESVDEFISYQKKWKTWGIIFFILGMLSLLSQILGTK